MTTSVFVDASAWIALNHKRDQDHQKAVTVNKQLLRTPRRYLTSNFVLDETYNGLLYQIGHHAAVGFGEKIRQSKLISIVHVTPEIEEAAWQLFKSYSDKTFSFTDCTSFVIVKQFGLTDAFTADHHFEQAGFSIFLK